MIRATLSRLVVASLFACAALIHPAFGAASTTPFFIEAEDFNFDGGRSLPEASEPGYLGGAYDGLAATHEVDYFSFSAEVIDNGVPPGSVYRMGESPNVPLNESNGDRQRGEFELTVNYRIGWAGNFWLNYTRKIPEDDYHVFVALSGVGFTMTGELDLVTSDPSVPEQTTERLGTFRAPSSGGWGANSLVAMKDADGQRATVRLGGAEPVTLRAHINTDFDYLMLVPARANTPIARPQVTLAIPADGAILDPIPDFRFVIKDAETAVVIESLVLQVDGRDVAAMVEDTEEGATVTYTPATPYAAGSEHAFQLSYTDDADPPVALSVAGTFGIVGGGKAMPFFIEAEDFNYDGGLAKPEASVMPYPGGAYDGLSAVPGVDYDASSEPLSDGVPPADNYRKGESPNVPHNNSAGDRQRGSIEMTVNYRIGWAGNFWLNYTRTFPEGHYQVFAACSNPDGNIGAHLWKVLSDPSQPDQELEDIGVCSGPKTSGWGSNQLAPLLDAEGSTHVIRLAGPTTIRVTGAQGDFDYLLFAPVQSAPPVKPTLAVTRLADGKVELRFQGILQAADAVTGSYQDQLQAQSPFTVTPSETRKFYRARSP
jgi:hypothetical protein